MRQVLRLDEVRKKIGRKNPDLITRDAGRKAYPILDEALREMPEGETLVLDADEIILIDGSFFDEAILNLFTHVLNNKFGQRYLLLINPTADSLDNIRGAIRNRNLKAAFPVMQDGTLQLVGVVEPNLDETVRLLARKGELTARELADTLKIGISNASNRLRRLCALHLAKRIADSDETGMFHRYYPVG